MRVLCCRNLGKLPDCTKASAEKKCHNPPNPPSPTPPPSPAPPTPPPTPPNPNAPRPHIILFVVDDQGHANVGYNNDGNVLTPHIDSAVKEGVKLDRMYLFRWCGPSRSALMTGRLPYHVNQQSGHVAREMTMLPAKLKQANYSTHQIGKSR